MRVSIDRGQFKQVDVRKVSRGQFLTERAGWLVEPVEEFIASRLDRFDTFLDPFAGEGHLLEVCGRAYGRRTAGFDLESPAWPRNDSLVSVPRIDRALIITNPPYLAKHSARRKGVLSLAQDYFVESGRDDLYKVALDRCRAAAELVVAIVPETIMLSGYPKAELALLAVIEEPLFSDTDSPVAVVCFDSRWRGDCDVYVGPERVGSLSSLLSFRPTSRDQHTRIRFNDPGGRIGLQAVDGVAPENRIRFMPADEFHYRRESVKHSSRLMTYVEVPDVSDADLRVVIGVANSLLEDVRQRTRDLILAPFKGNNKDGVRRRRLDYAVARGVLSEAIARTRATAFRRLSPF